MVLCAIRGKHKPPINNCQGTCFAQAVNAIEDAMGNKDEFWIPRCPRCADSNLVLAPANQFTKGIVDKTEIYCTHCQWRGVLAEEIERIYVRT